MYEEFFQLKSKPFELVPNPEFLFLSRSHKKAITYLDYGIKEKIGFILLTGEVGSGKTTILRNLIRKLDDKVVLSKIFNTKVSSDQLIAMINDDFGLAVAGKDKITLLRDLYEFLVEQYAVGNQPILIIDEAQNLSADLLEEVRLLSNLESDRTKLLQIVLVGQPELKHILAQPELKQLRQRISLSCHLKPLSQQETREYIFHRLEKAGNRMAIKLPDDTFETIYQFSRGIPRLVNIICDFLMISAYAEQRHDLTVELVREVIGELEEDGCYWDDTLPGNVCRSKYNARSGSSSGHVPAPAVNGGEFVSKLADIEKSVDYFASEVRSRLTTLDDSLTTMAHELVALKSRTEGLESKDEDPPDKKKKGMLHWLTS